MKIYLVSRGDFDNQCIIGASSTKEKANEFISVVKSLGVVPDINSTPEEAEVDELDKYVLMLKEGYKQYHIYMFRDGSSKIEEEKSYHFRNSTFVLNNSHLTKSILKDNVFLYGIVWAKTAEHAIELINKKRNELQEKGEW